MNNSQENRLPHGNLRRDLIRFAGLCLTLTMAHPTIAQTDPIQPAPTPLLLAPPPAAPSYLPFPQLPPLLLDEANNGIGIAQQSARATKAQARVLWIDGTANLNRVNTPDKIAALTQQIKNTGFNTVVFDVKPIVGFTLYPSKFAPKLTEWKGNQTLPADFDPLAEMVKQCHAAGLQLVASMNVFSEGHRDVLKGPGYDHPEWQTTLYEVATQMRPAAPGSTPFLVSDHANGPARSDSELAVYTSLAGAKLDRSALVAILDATGAVVAQMEGTAIATLGPNVPDGGCALVGIGPSADFLRQHAPLGEKLTPEMRPTYVPIRQRPEQQVPLMVNPNNPDVQRRILDMIAEVTRNYAVDGVIFDDRLRYAGINADFSETTRQQFEQYVGKPLQWPDDVFHYEIAFPGMTRHIVPGSFYDDWLLWRALTIRNWLATAVNTVKAIRQTATVSVYCGSWYGEYPLLGSNWAANDFQAGFRFLTPAYRKTGFAGLVDWITTGCYYPTASIAEATASGRSAGASIEAAGQLCNRAVNDQTWIYAGISIAGFTQKPAALKNALQAATAATQGVMVFDLSYMNETLWATFAEAFREQATPPHAVPGLLAQVRRDRAARTAAGIPDPPVIILGGIPGTGL